MAQLENVLLQALNEIIDLHNQPKGIFCECQHCTIARKAIMALESKPAVVEDMACPVCGAIVGSLVSKSG